MSFGSSTYTPPCDASFPDWAAALGTLRTAVVTVFAASGNGNDKSHLDFPACLSNAVSVGAVYDANVGSKTWCLSSSCTLTCTDATTAADKVTCFSNSHSQLDLLAPGASMRSSHLNNTAKEMSGTSMAALMLEADPAATPDELESCMKGGGLQVTDPANGVTTPRVDAAGLVNCAAGGLAVCPKKIGNGKDIPGNDLTDPNFMAGDCDNDGLPDASDPDPGGDITYDDNNNGIPCPTDPADDGLSWDHNCNAKRDGVEGICPLAVNP